jgi:hypothetical protein
MALRLEPRNDADTPEKAQSFTTGLEVKKRISIDYDFERSTRIYFSKLLTCYYSA